MLNMIMAILIEREVVTETEGKALVDKILHSTLPADFASSQKLLKKFLIQIEKEL